jgi:hypothetical protein
LQPHQKQQQQHTLYRLGRRLQLLSHHPERSQQQPSLLLTIAASILLQQE